jgi:hypothetical protein
LSAKETCAAISDVLAEARTVDGGIDVLAELGVKHKRWPAVMWIIETLIADAAARIENVSSPQLPSNLDWSTFTPLEDMVCLPIRVDQISYSNSVSPAQWDELHFDPRYTDQMAREKYSAAEQIWMSLGSIILEAADLPSEQSSQVMNYAYQIIARLHNFGFVPEHIYSYVHTSPDAAVRRPPIMHLLSSRILSTLSDAVWRAHQDEVISQAASAGATYRDLGHDPPGGRFRLKVRDLGPEVWLEFILWCCVDGGFDKAGSWIVERMRTRNTDSPWFGTPWTSAATDGASDEALIDWARVKLRHGGTVGQIEGYSRERPFVEMEPRTISVEVVLALIEASINARSLDLVGRGCTQAHTQTSIFKLLLFLEPHGLPQRYFDYLTVRLLQPDLFDFQADATTLQSLVERLRYIRSLETTCKPAEHLPSLEVDSVLEQSEVYAGVLHQALERLAVAGRARPAVEIFNQIQDLVDQSKLRAIGSFLHTRRQPDLSFFSSREFAFSQEYTSSHGQLPTPKLAPFLDLVTDARLFEFGKWLLYSMDVDGPLIPLSLYSRTSLAPAILRFAAATEDVALIEDVADAIGLRYPKPPVSYFRSFADARLQLKDFEGAGHAFAALNEAKGGGNSLANVATIIATVMRIEYSAEHAWQERRPRLLSPGLSLLEWVLKGDFQGISGNFRKNQIAEYRRGLACLLRVVEAIPGTVLSDVARSWIPKIADANVVGLHPNTFDIVLSAVVETKGAKVGMMLWDLFCEEPAQQTTGNQPVVETADTGLASTPDGLGVKSNETPARDSRFWLRNTMLPKSIDDSSSSSMNDVVGGPKMYSTGKNAIFAEYGLDGNESDAGLANGNADIERATVDVNELSFSRLSIGRRSYAQAMGPLRYKSSAPKKQNSTLQQSPPSADVSLLGDRFKEMISEDSVPDSTDDDENLLRPPSTPTNPVVRPTFRTLRIIIRSALQDLEAAKSLWYAEDLEVDFNTSEVPAKANMRALEAAMTDIELVERWAKPLFHRFGISDDDVMAEFGWNLREKNNIFSTTELKKRHAAAKTEYELAKMGLLADVSERNVRKRFLGPQVKRTEGEVKKYTARELAFYFNKKNSVEEDLTEKDVIQEDSTGRSANEKNPNKKRPNGKRS